jgi:hypothetical protein
LANNLLFYNLFIMNTLRKWLAEEVGFEPTRSLHP